MLFRSTVPEPVRKALRLGRRDRLRYEIRPGGEVVLTRGPSAGEEDPALGRFLAFLARDIAEHPERLRALDTGLVRRLRSLTRGAEVDLDAPLSVEDE